MRRKVRLAIASLCVVAIAALTGGGGMSPQAAPPDRSPALEVQPVRGLTVGPGQKLWVFVFPERGKGKPSPEPDCTDGNQGGHAVLGFVLPNTGFPFNINDGSIPIDQASALTALQNSFAAWETATGKNLFAVNNSGGAGGPAQDGNNTVGWVRIVPRNTLAAAWVWTTTVGGVETVTDADIFFNLFHTWDVLAGCGGSAFDVENVGVHEIGHVVGLDHIKDAEAMASMYPSAGQGEVKKRTLTTGDANGAVLLTNHL